MIVGTLPKELLAKIEVPEDVMEAAWSTEIVTHDHDLPGFGTVWLTCCEAHAHTDEYHEDKMFLSLVIVGDHVYGEIRSHVRGKSECREIRADPGVLFLTDPRKLHWLYCERFASNYAPYRTDRPQPFVAIQWVFPRRSYRTRVQSIMNEIGAIPS